MTKDWKKKNRISKANSVESIAIKPAQFRKPACQLSLVPYNTVTVHPLGSDLVSSINTETVVILSLVGLGRARGHSLKFHSARERLIGKPCWGNRLSIPWTVIRFDNALRSDVAIAVRDNRNKFPTPFAANTRSACGFHQHSDWRLNQPAFFIDVSLFHLSLSTCLPVCPLRAVSCVQPCVQDLPRGAAGSIY